MLKLSAVDIAIRNQMQIKFLDEYFCFKTGNLYFTDFVKNMFVKQISGHLVSQERTVSGYGIYIYGQFYDALTISVEDKKFDQDHLDVTFQLGVTYDNFEPDSGKYEDLINIGPFIKKTRPINILIEPILGVKYSTTLAFAKKWKANLLIINEYASNIKEIEESVNEVFLNEGITILKLDKIANSSLPQTFVTSSTQS